VTGYEQNALLERDFKTTKQIAVTTAQTIQTTPALKRLAHAWQPLAAQAGRPMQDYIWAQAGAETFTTHAKSYCITVGDPERPTAIAPLVKRGNFFAHLETLTVRELYEPMDLLYADAPALEALANTLAKSGMALQFGRVPTESPTIAALQKAYRGRGWLHLSEATPYPYIELHEGWREPEQQFNSGRRSDFRRAERNASKLGTVSYEILTPAVTELESLLEEAFEVEAAGWKGTTGSALARDTERGAFYRRYAALAAAQGILRVCFLRIGGHAVAMQFAVECYNRFWLIKIGYNEQFSRCSPGTLLMLHTVKYAAARALRSYEFLGLCEPWTQHWTQTLRPCVALRAYPLNWRGTASLVNDAARLAWKKLSQRVGGEA
jgi:CelD/BcsL family acetyltransferase involved in cellulose biosynthesis